MEQTPIPPLVSDKEIIRNATVQSNALMALHNDDFAAGERARGYVNGAIDTKTTYETELLKTREVVQALCDALHAEYKYAIDLNSRSNINGPANGGEVERRTVKALALAQSTMNIVPKP